MNRGWTIPDQYRDRGGDLDTCPECGGPKTKHGTVCIACRRRLGRFARPVADRFWEKVDKSGECWEWTAARDPNGYGRFTVRRGLSVKAGKLAWEWANGPMPAGLYLCHSCDNPPCVRPSHLWLGTQADNIADMIAKGRGSWQKSA